MPSDNMVCKRHPASAMSPRAGSASAGYPAMPSNVLRRGKNATSTDPQNSTRASLVLQHTLRDIAPGYFVNNAIPRICNDHVSIHDMHQTPDPIIYSIAFSNSELEVTIQHDVVKRISKTATFPVSSNVVPTCD
eukprot:673985-Amphidinium_carterae.1